MVVTKSVFDQVDNFTCYSVTNQSNQLTVNVLDYGATIQGIIFGSGSQARDVTLGFDDLAGYQSKYLRNPYFGASVGRVANR